jgi:hypothetical protein
MQTGQTCVFGSPPKAALQPQKILVSVSSWAWISSPMTGSKFANYVFGPAARTAGVTPPANDAKFSLNISASFRACAS